MVPPSGQSHILSYLFPVILLYSLCQYNRSSSRSAFEPQDYIPNEKRFDEFSDGLVLRQNKSFIKDSIREYGFHYLKSSIVHRTSENSSVYSLVGESFEVNITKAFERNLFVNLKVKQKYNKQVNSKYWSS